MNNQFGTIPLFKVFSNTPAILEGLGKVFDSGYIGQGKQVDKFEKELGKKLCNYNIITTNSGTSAEYLALQLLDLPVGSEVLCCSLSCFATIAPLLEKRLKIKWIDTNKYTLNIDLDDLQRKLSRDTKLIVLVHYGGYPVDLNKLNKILTPHYNLYRERPYVIEDCAHAIGTKFNEKLLSAHVDYNYRFYSLQAIKHLNTVDGGFLITPQILHGGGNPYNIYNHAKKLRWYGFDRSQSDSFRCKQNLVNTGLKLHMNDVNATVGLANLSYLDWILKRHRDNAQYYDDQLLEPHDNDILVLQSKNRQQSSSWLYTVAVNRRDDFIKYMKECDIDVGMAHARCDKHSCVSDFKSQLPSLDWIDKRYVSIPVGWWVEPEHREYIVDCIKKGW